MFGGVAVAESNTALHLLEPALRVYDGYAAGRSLLPSPAATNYVARRQSWVLYRHKKSVQWTLFLLNGGSCGIRTYDQLVKSQLLYQLS